MQEREFKLELDEVSAARVMQALGHPAKTLLQVNHYLVDPGGRLKEARCGLRLRRTIEVPAPASMAAALRRLEDPEAGTLSGCGSGPGPAWTLTLKGPSRLQGALHERAESEGPLAPRLAERLLAGASVEEVFSEAPLPPALHEVRRLGLDLQALRIQGATCNLRQSFPFPTASGRPPGETAPHFDLDITRYPDGEVGFELEFELLGGARSDSGTDVSTTPAGKPPPGEPTAGRPPDWEARLRRFLEELGVAWIPAAQGKYARYLARKRS